MAVCAEPSRTHGVLDSPLVEFKCSHHPAHCASTSLCTSVCSSPEHSLSGCDKVVIADGASRPYEYGQVLQYLSGVPKMEEGTFSASGQTEQSVMDPHAQHREMLARMSAFSNGVAPAAPPQSDGKHVVVSPRGIHDMMLFDFEAGTQHALVESQAAVSNQQSCYPSGAPIPREVSQTDHLVHGTHGISHHDGVNPIGMPQQGLTHPMSGHHVVNIPSATQTCSLDVAQGCSGAYHVKDEMTFARENTGPISRLGLGHSTQPPSYVHASVQHSPCPPRSVVVPPSNFAQDQITPWLEDATNPVERTAMDKDENVRAQANSLNMEIENSSSSKLRGPQRSGGGPSSGVMPPTAKSILDRRERAIREGRRHEAKLTDEERRILRRLRNRESAERCAKRKNEQADMLARKISTLERENRELRSLASQYENEISKLERYLMSRPLNHATHAWSPEQ